MFAKTFLLLIAGLQFFNSSAQVSTSLHLPAVFSDNMVLQQGIRTSVWGTGKSSAKVQVTMSGKSVMSDVKPDGKWEVKLPVMKAGGPFDLKVNSDGESIVYHNVMIGEVWVCSGQSNMEMPLAGWGKIKNYEEEISKANYPAIRLFQVQHATSNTPLDDVKADGDKWQVCDPTTIDKFSATAYFFARTVYEKTHVAIGLIHTSWGGTIAEAWTSGEALKTMPDFAPAVQKMEAAGDSNVVVSAKPVVESPNRVTVLYNAMIHPLIKYGIKGAIWYQGESNAGRAYQYRTLFPLMITDWRKQWGQGNFPFYFVQLANYTETNPQPGPSDWAELREAQLKTLSLPSTGMAVIIDIGETKDIHPKNKQDVGKRLGLIALNKTYGVKVPFSGPAYTSFTKEGKQLRVKFSEVYTGLSASDGGPLKGFAIAGEDQKFYWADAKIEGSQVVVSSPEVPNPVAVRYAWASNPISNLVNKEGLPASPFRSDDWPMVTKK